MSDKPVCNRCGRCCYYDLDGKIKKCKNLVRLKSGTTLCRIWTKPDRIGTVLDTRKDGVDIVCNQIEDIPYSFKGCPFNKEKPLLKIFVGD